jgi:hypothetical protein
MRFMKMKWNLDMFFPEFLRGLPLPNHQSIISPHPSFIASWGVRSPDHATHFHIFLFFSGRALAWLQSKMFLYRLGKDSEGGDHDLFQGTISEFARTDQGKSQNTCQDRLYLGWGWKPCISLECCSFTILPIVVVKRLALLCRIRKVPG